MPISTYNQDREYHFLGNENAHLPKEIFLKNTEIIKVGNESIPYPCDRIELKPPHFKKVEEQHETNDPRKPKKGDKILELYTLFPPIIVNLRKDAPSSHPNTREVLTETELNYLHKHQSLAVLFIHGFNLSYGDYSRQIVGIKPYPFTLIDQQANFYEDKAFIYTDSLSTILREQSIIEKTFNQGKPFAQKIKDEELNGTGAHNWFIHMEDNLNRAASRIKLSNYNQYFRIIHIAWSGDVLPVAYLDAEERANEAGKTLTKLLQQLSNEKMEIYIIAHSLGTRVALSAMNDLAENGFEYSIKQVFLWQAAVADSALSNNPNRDHSVKYNNHFPNAYLSTQRINVLYSKNDWVLRFHYWLANRIGVTPGGFIENEQPIQLLYRFMDQDPAEVLLFAKLLKNDLNFCLTGKTKNRELDLFLRLLKECYRLPKTAQAMGYHGVDRHDPFMHKLINSGKLALINQPFLEAHSAMKIPNENMMNLVYKRWIINQKQGISKFLYA